MLLKTRATTRDANPGYSLRTFVAKPTVRVLMKRFDGFSDGAGWNYIASRRRLPRCWGRLQSRCRMDSKQQSLIDGEGVLLPYVATSQDGPTRREHMSCLAPEWLNQKTTSPRARKNSKFEQ
eukprot:6469832-Amphidinium_carterae.1